jgi:hypothetical protein
MMPTLDAVASSLLAAGIRQAASGKQAYSNCQ